MPLSRIFTKEYLGLKRTYEENWIFVVWTLG
jgi:hypothetical protein